MSSALISSIFSIKTLVCSSTWEQLAVALMSSLEEIEETVIAYLTTAI